MVKLPSLPVTVPFAVPLIAMLTPDRGSPVSESTFPLISTGGIAWSWPSADMVNASFSFGFVVTIIVLYLIRKPSG